MRTVRQALKSGTFRSRVVHAFFRVVWLDGLLLPLVADGRDTNKAYHLLFEGYSKDLPDLNIVLNLNDQPIGFVSWEERQRLIEAGQKGICEFV